MELNSLLENPQYRQELFNTIAEKVAEALKPPKFTGRGVPLTVAARVMGKNTMALRRAIDSGRMELGFVVEGEGRTRICYVSPKLLYEQTGYKHKPSLVKEEEA